MDRNYVYENAPLQEVIVEIHWELESLSVAPGAAIDRFWKELSSKIAVNMQKNGFNITESLVPEQVPIELFAHQVVKRFRKAENEWPVYQIGPGVFTINTTPPYNGWKNFNLIIKNGVSYLLKSYPDSKKHLKFERISVRYLNFFAKDHGVENPAKFIKEKLNLAVSIPNKIAKTAGDNDHEILTSGTVDIPVAALEGGTGSIIWRAGHRGGQSGVYLEFRVSAVLGARPIQASNLCKIADSCHDVIGDWFDGLVADRMKRLLGKRINIGDGKDE